ncbi:hypothetical protein QBC47DRAFT_461855 [Echria macrotheca]|uniref:Developmental regulatory protein wetA n=1 Tax=Echria macrotheca TaxID=438768 RepID=A0AAJ0BBM4_9PEZI|nr:hypothetical protein QBC47DRAFT_461855 [Echria macrotheca]
MARVQGMGIGLPMAKMASTTNGTDIGVNYSPVGGGDFASSADPLSPLQNKGTASSRGRSGRGGPGIGGDEEGREQGGWQGTNENHELQHLHQQMAVETADSFFDEFVVLDGGESLLPPSSSSTAPFSSGRRGGLVKADEGVAPATGTSFGSVPLSSHSSGVTPPGNAAPGQPGNMHQQLANQAGQHLDMFDMSGLPSSFPDLPGTGSISDSELLKLEGLSMRSSRPPVATASASEPPSPPSHATGSPRKAGRLETLYSRARAKMASLHPRGKHQPQISRPGPAQAMSTAPMEPPKTNTRPRPRDLHIPNSSQPMSLPLTSSAGEGLVADPNHLVLDFAAVNELFGGPEGLQMNLPGNGISGTPLDTPLDGHFGPATSTGCSTTSQQAAFTPVGLDENCWWDPAMNMEMDIDDPNFFTTPSTYKQADFQLALQLQQQGYAPASAGSNSLHNSGLMIHMPQPRGSGSTMLHPALQLSMAQAQAQAQHAQARFQYPPPPPMPNSVSAGDLNSSPRRHKPRAPSSGARHHHYHPGTGGGVPLPSSSPRKGRTASGSGPGSIPSTPSTAYPPSTNPSRLHRRSASMQTLRTADPSTPSAVRKRKSWTGRRVSGSHDNNNHHHPYPSCQNGGGGGGSTNGSPRKTSRRTSSTTSAKLTSASMASLALESFEREKEAGGFVNYTPEDHRVLMTGVAPSGSSKTKARREREAAEQKRKLGEAVRKAVEAAGGDVRKLEDEGIGLGDWLEGRERRDG